MEGEMKHYWLGVKWMKVKCMVCGTDLNDIKGRHD